MNAFDPVAAVRVLQRAGVRFVIDGSFACWLHGSPHLTAALEICTEDAAENRNALAAALAELNAAVLSSEPLVYETSAGALAVSTATADFNALAGGAAIFEIADGVHVSAVCGSRS
jgi:hypothetical protein